jgi:thiamine biosynthesis lipoprotein ApbE
VAFGHGRRFSLADVETVINAPEFYRDGDAYFTGVWQQAETSKPPGQTAVLHTLARHDAQTSEVWETSEVSEIARQAGLAPEKVSAALETLARHDVVMKMDEESGHWQFTVELMRCWVAQR